MQFINPFDLLDLEASEVPSSDEIREAKRRVDLEFDLADGNSTEINGYLVLRSDFLRATDELDDEQKREFYFELHERLPKLNRFLVDGNLDFFREYQYESLFSHQPFVEFVSPHFARQYNRQLRSALKDADHSRIGLITSHDPLVTEEHKSELYKGAKQHLRHLREDIESIIRRVKNGNIVQPQVIRDQALEVVDENLLNALPDDLEGERSQLASTYRDLSVTVFNAVDDAGLARDLLLEVRDLKASQLTENRLENSLEEIEDIYEQRRLADRYSDELEEYGRTITRLSELIEEADKSGKKPEHLHKEARDVVDIDTLNELPDDFEEARSQVALGLKNLATAIWNNNQRGEIVMKRGEIAISLTKLALKIQVGPSLEKDLRDDLELLRNLTEEVESELVHQLAAQIGDLRSKIESVGGLFSQKTVDWAAVKAFIRSTFTDEYIRLLENANSSDKRKKLFEDLAFVLSSTPSNGFYRERLFDLVEDYSSIDSPAKTDPFRTSSSQSSPTAREEDESTTLGELSGLDDLRREMEEEESSESGEEAEQEARPILDKEEESAKTVSTSKTRQDKKKESEERDSNIGYIVAAVILVILLFLSNL